MTSVNTSRAKNGQNKNVRRYGNTLHFQKILFKNRSWVVFLSSLLLFLFYVVGTPLLIIYQRSTPYYVQLSQDKELARMYLSQKIFQEMQLGGVILLITTVLAIINGLQVFSYQFSTKEVDFYASLPVKRSTRFVQRYLNGALVYILPLILCSGLSWMIASGLDATTRLTLRAAAYGMVRLIVYYLSMYSLSVLAAMLSGRMIYANLMLAFLSLVEAALNLLIAMCRSMYLHTYYARNESLYDQYRLFTSPVYSMLLGRHRMLDIITPDGVVDSGYHLVQVDMPSFLWMLGLAVVFTALSVVTFYLRKPELAGASLTFQPVRIAMRIFVGVFGGLFIGIIMDQAFYHLTSRIATILVFLGAVVSTMLLTVAFDAITRVNLKQGMKKWYITAVSCGLVIFSMVCFRFDVFGYDSYVPALSRVQDVGFYLLSTQDVRMRGSKDTNSVMHIKDVETVEKLAELGQKHLREVTGGTRGDLAMMNPNSYSYYGSGADTEGEGFGALVVYHMKNGKNIYRRLLIPFDVDPDLMDQVLSSEEYKAAWYRLPEASQLGEESNLSISYDVAYDSRSLTETSGLMEDFVHAYNTDLTLYSYSFVQKADPVGMVKWTTNQSEFQYEVYPSYTNTIAFLQKHDLYLPAVPSYKILRKLTLSRNLLVNGESKETIMDSIENSAQMKLTLEDAVYNDQIFADWKDNYSKHTNAWVREGDSWISYSLFGERKVDQDGDYSLSLRFHGSPSKETLNLFSGE